MDLYEVPARVIKCGNGCVPDVCGLQTELNAQLIESCVFCVNIVNSKRGRGDPLLIHSPLEGHRGRVVAGLKEQLGTFRLFGLDHGQPFEFANWKILFLDKAQDLGVELQGFVLVVYKHTG
jgi:hypothetical protein